MLKLRRESSQDLSRSMQRFKREGPSALFTPKTFNGWLPEGCRRFSFSRSVLPRRNTLRSGRRVGSYVSRNTSNAFARQTGTRVLRRFAMMDSIPVFQRVNEVYWPAGGRQQRSRPSSATAVLPPALSGSRAFFETQ